MKRLKSKTIIFLVAIIIGLFAIISCGKTSCYDEQLYQQHKDDLCPAHCPGVKGCDGKKYCNECEANTQGIRVVK